MAAKKMKKQSKIIHISQILGMEELTTSFGKFSMKEEQGYLTPKDDESRNALRKYL